MAMAPASEANQRKMHLLNNICHRGGECDTDDDEGAIKLRTTGKNILGHSVPKLEGRSLSR